eukprot:1159744-Pelagomonas_calceolata.AAC.12
MKILVPSVQDCFQAAYPTKHTTYQDAPVPRWTKTQTWTYRLRQEKDNKSHGASKVICACTCSLYLPGPHFSSGSSAMQNMFTPLMGVPSCGVHTRQSVEMSGRVSMCQAECRDVRQSVNVSGRVSRRQAECQCVKAKHYTRAGSAAHHAKCIYMYISGYGATSCHCRSCSCGAHQAEEAKRKWSGPDEVLCPDAAP